MSSRLVLSSIDSFLGSLEDVVVAELTSEGVTTLEQLRGYARQTVVRGARRAVLLAHGAAEGWQPTTRAAARTLKHELQVGLRLQTLHSSESIGRWAREQLELLPHKQFRQVSLEVGLPVWTGNERRKPYRRLIRGLPPTWVDMALEASETCRPDLRAAMLLLALTGARPCEVAGAEIRRTGTGLEVTIQNAKRAVHMRDRSSIGFERVLTLRRRAVAGTRERRCWVEELDRVLGNHQVVRGGVVQQVKPSQIDAMCLRIGKKAFPERQQALRASCFRNQLCADLKAAGLGRDSIAYAMGHDVPRTAGFYGTAHQAGAMNREYLLIELPVIQAQQHGTSPAAQPSVPVP